APWRFILFEGASRMRAGEIFAEIYAKAHPGEDDRRVEAERNRFSLAPLVVGVISRAAPHPKIPEWEQILSAGAACMNLMVAANALGFASVWLTGWHAYDRSVLARIGVAEHERVAGFIHIGRADDPREDRPRPLLADIVTRFRAYYDAWPTAVRAIGDFGNGEYVGAQADSSASSRSDGRRGRSAARRSAVAPDAFA